MKLNEYQVQYIKNQLNTVSYVYCDQHINDDYDKFWITYNPVINMFEIVIDRADEYDTELDSTIEPVVTLNDAINKAVDVGTDCYDTTFGKFVCTIGENKTIDDNVVIGYINRYFV